MIVTVLCQRCGTAYETNRPERSRYCSRICQTVAISKKRKPIADQGEILGECFREIAGCPGYSVSDHGRVRGRNDHIVKPRPNQQGYLRVSVWINGRARDRYIHDLMLSAFVGPRPSPEHEADHQDDDRANNRLDNLQWLTLAANRAKRKVAKGEASGAAKLQAYQVAAIRRECNRGRTDAAIARDFGISRRQVGDIRQGIAWRHL